ncbi:mediator of RNA polymerase II transcription subunit 15 isoform A [Patagioenas fasciata monilis]|uniref:Mediator of RNA polymerase II transcription subunit 15 n=1 Tax=Patagioenas fasciata monilis TaxID=372326 RepID=A0A1V4JRX9_PATFA|nr:mediator of RNA polymerase II transcription subunit 15 isoform A [Patagioenas fasciata monilis]
MDVTGPETDWRSTNFRQKLVSQIDEAMRKAGVAHNKSSKDMESHVFMKAKTREEYLSLVARLIIHFRDIHNKKSQASVSDPMNALQNLTGGPPAGAPGMGMASRAQGAPMSGMSGLGPMGQQMSLPGQQQPPGTSGMAPHGMPGVSTATQQTQLQLQQIAQQQQQQQQQFQQQQVALQQQQFQAQQSAMQQQFQVRAQLVQQQQAAAAVQAAQAQAAQMGASGQVSQNNITMMSSPSPVQQAQTPQSMPPPPQPQPSPQPGQPTSQPNSNVSSGPAPSPSSFLPSPSPQPSQSPAAARTPQNFSVPSPGPLNTPGNPNSVMSPASSSQSEEQQYLEKLKQLSKYIEPLRRMINKIDKNEDRKKDLSKMKSLLDILTDPSKRCPLKTLQKCEIALEKLKNDMAVPTPPPPPVPPTKQQYLCQPLLDAVLANIRSPVFNHSLYRTFMPAMTAIHGPPITAPIASPRKRKYEEDERQTIPNVLQGEVARLNPKFLVNLDPSHCSNNGTVHLICKLDDKNLPNVPPLQLSVPADYPDQSPLWIKNPRQYAANPFLQSVYRYMTSKLLQLPDKHSVTALLNTWAQSIRQACLSAA